MLIARCWLPRAWCVCFLRDAFKHLFDSYCGLCIIALYFLYLNVVKGALSVFDCSKNKDGKWILDTDPSIKCYVVRALAPASRGQAACRVREL